MWQKPNMEALQLSTKKLLLRFSNFLNWSWKIKLNCRLATPTSSKDVMYFNNDLVIFKFFLNDYFSGSALVLNVFCDIFCCRWLFSKIRTILYFYEINLIVRRSFFAETFNEAWYKNTFNYTMQCNVQSQFFKKEE